MRVRVDFHARQVTVNQRDEAREFARLKTRLGLLVTGATVLVVLQTINVVSLIWGSEVTHKIYNMILCGVETAEMCRT